MLLSRGFNQAGFIAEVAAKELKIKLRCNILVKTRETAPQSKLGRRGRQANVKNAFKAGGNETKGSAILLIDDIYTTGTTVDECCRVLKKAGAKAVYIVTAAIGKGFN